MVADLIVLGGLAAAVYLVNKKKEPLNLKPTNGHWTHEDELAHPHISKSDSLKAQWQRGEISMMEYMNSLNTSPKPSKADKLHDALAAQNAAKILAEQQRAAAAEKAAEAERIRIQKRDAEVARVKAEYDAAIKKQNDAAAYAASPAGQAAAQAEWEAMASRNKELTRQNKLADIARKAGLEQAAARAKVAAEGIGQAAKDAWAKIVAENTAKSDWDRMAARNTAKKNWQAGTITEVEYNRIITANPI